MWQRQVDLCEFEASLVYRASSRRARGIERPCLKQLKLETAGQWWHMSFIPTLGRQSQADQRNPVSKNNNNNNKKKKNKQHQEVSIACYAKPTFTTHPCPFPEAGLNSNSLGVSLKVLCPPSYLPQPRCFFGDDVVSCLLGFRLCFIFSRIAGSR